MLRPSWSSEAGKNVTMKKLLLPIFALIVFVGASAAEVDLPHPDDWKNSTYDMKHEFESLEKELVELVARDDWKEYRSVVKRVREKEDAYMLKFYECYRGVIADSSPGNISAFRAAFNLFMCLRDLVAAEATYVGFVLRTKKRRLYFLCPGLGYDFKLYSLKEWYDRSIPYLIPIE